jgi:hypothetical protein
VDIVNGKPAADGDSTLGRGGACHVHCVVTDCTSWKEVLVQSPHLSPLWTECPQMFLGVFLHGLLSPLPHL